ncbi:MAG: DUF4405 domain-containing protein [Bacteroidota bacterium]
MKKSNQYLLVDVLMFIFLAMMTGLGLMIKYILVPGSKRWEIYGRNVDLTFLGLDRHGWGTVHLICSICFLVLLAIHIILHWKCLVGYVCKIVHTKANAYIVLLAFGFLLFFIIVIPLMVNIKVTDIGVGRERFLHQSGQEHIPAAVQREGLISPDVTGKSAEGQLQEAAKEETKETQERKVKKQADKPVESVTGEPVESGRGLEHHDIDPDIKVYGSMSLISVSLEYNVPVSHIIEELDLPASTSGNEQMGHLRRAYGFNMSDVEMIIHNYRRK